MPDEDDIATADFDRPNAARIHDWLLGGSLNTPIDREAATTAPRWLPLLRDVARDNREFLGRAVHRMLDAGLRQFLDLGSGLPTMGATHLVTRRHADASVVYTDHDPATVARTNIILDTTPQAIGIHADLRRPGEVLGHPDVRRLLRNDQPIGLLAIDIIDTLPDEGSPDRLLETYLAAMAPRSMLALTHLTTWKAEDASADEDRGGSRIWVERHPRAQSVVQGWVAGLAPIHPALPSLPTRYSSAGDEDAPLVVEITRSVFVKA
ncbi:SAM-dependent methyltransferase [Actinosynnema sp. CA-248983]